MTTHRLSAAGGGSTWTLAAAGASGLLAEADFTYLGAFRSPSPLSNGGRLSDVERGIGYDPADGNLFVTCWLYPTGEMACYKAGVPALSTSGTISALNRATVAVNPTDIFSGHTSGLTYFNKVGGYLVYNGRLIWTLYAYYTNAELQYASHGYCGLDLTGSNGIYTLDNNGYTNARKWAGYMGVIPSGYQATFGNKPAFTGAGNYSIVGTSNSGPGLVSFDPDQLGVSSPVPADPWMIFEPEEFDPNDGTYNAGPDLLWCLLNEPVGVFFHNAGGKRGIGVVVRRGTGIYWYGDPNYEDWRGSIDFPTDFNIPALQAGQSHYGTFGNPAGWPSTDTEGRYCSDSVVTPKGPHAPPYEHAVYLFNPESVAAAADPNDPRPYTIASLSNPFGLEQNSLHGATYDPVNKRLYVTLLHPYDGSEASPLFLVYQLPA